MKKFKYHNKFWVLFLLSVIFAGCGGGGGGGGSNPNASSIYFAMAVSYNIKDDSTPYTIPSEKAVKFYTFTEATYNKIKVDVEAKIEADHVFTGTTGNSSLKFTLPDYLNNQKRYIYAVVDLNGSFDLRGKKTSELMEAFDSGNILFGKAVDVSGNDVLFTLTNGTTIGNFEFMGKTAGEKANLISFTMPKNSASGTPIPSGKTVIFYALKNTTAPIDVEYSFKGTTGSSNIEFELPADLIGEEYRFWAVVNINGSFDLQGATLELLLNAIKENEVLYGKSNDSTLYTLSEGINYIGNFEFLDADAISGGGESDSSIDFTMAVNYLGPPSEPGAGDNPVYTIPENKVVNFYAIDETNYQILENNINQAIDVQLILSGNTNDDTFRTPLSNDLMGQKRHFIAVVVLTSEPFELDGMTPTLLKTAIEDGDVLYGKSLKLGSGEIELYTINVGTNNIGNFEFFGVKLD